MKSFTDPAEGHQLSFSEKLGSREKAEHALERLLDVIKEQNIDESGKAKQVYAELAISTANSYLSHVVFSQLILFIPQISKRTLSGIISIIKTIRDQHINDFELIKYCEEFIETVEAIPGFKKLSDTYDSIFLNIFDQGPLSDIASKLLNGDLSELAKALDNSFLSSNVAMDIGACLWKKDGSSKFKSMQNEAFPKFGEATGKFDPEKLKKDTAAALLGLQEKQDHLQKLTRMAGLEYA